MISKMRWSDNETNSICLKELLWRDGDFTTPANCVKFESNWDAVAISRLALSGRNWSSILWRSIEPNG